MYSDQIHSAFILHSLIMFHFGIVGINLLTFLKCMFYSFILFCFSHCYQSGEWTVY